MNKFQRIKAMLTTLVFIVRHPVDAYHLMRMDKAAATIDLMLYGAANAESEEGIWQYEEAADYWSFVWEDIWSEHLPEYDRIKVQIFGSALRLDHGWYMRLIDRIRR